MIDEGAAQALRGGGSLLPVGVVSVDGDFERGDVIAVLDDEGKRLALGVSAYSGEHARQIAGKRSDEVLGMLSFIGRDELIHRNDLVMV